MQEGDHDPFGLLGGRRKRKIKEMRTIFLGVLLGLTFVVLKVHGEDMLRLKNGEILKGQAIKFDEVSMTLTFKFAQGTLGYPSADLVEVTLEERPELRRVERPFRKEMG